MTKTIFGWTVFSLGIAFSPPLSAQVIVSEHESIPIEQPDAWAMAYVTAASLMTGFGETPDLETGEWMLSAEAGHIPKLSKAEQMVGLNGIKFEDLNKSPVFGRARVWAGLPAGFVLELGYTPPIEIKGARPQDLFAIGLGKRWLNKDNFSLSSRIHAQHGQAIGDVTCPSFIAGIDDFAINPFGCQSASEDKIKMNYFAAETSLGFGPKASPWRGFGSVGIAKLEPQVNINAEQAAFTNRNELSSNAYRPYYAIGLQRISESAWHWSSEILYVPLDIKRPNQDENNEAFWSLRMMLRYKFSKR